jgi:hypothetical protein
MVRYGNHDRVDVLLLVEHLAEVRPLLRLGILLKDAPGVLLIHIAQGNDILAAALVEVPLAPPADPDAGDIELLARRHIPRPTQHLPRHDRKRCHRRGFAHETPA